MYALGWLTGYHGQQSGLSYPDYNPFGGAPDAQSIYMLQMAQQQMAQQQNAAYAFMPPKTKLQCAREYAAAVRQRKGMVVKRLACPT